MKCCATAATTTTANHSGFIQRDQAVSASRATVPQTVSSAISAIGGRYMLGAPPMRASSLHSGQLAASAR